ncbi:hypothetical protein PHISCL_04981 [Aspergillus sclerotialis]|uniref:Tubby C-terminal-like domain-containing protein n=1 Tax=Aspergillus sclerotialis TaxID=2070753 RepID=A0A3A2ZHI3_9EURO|nr:hypothetical protein PHISCL_04981 [Aspergillus sclerotialis]
MAKLPEPVELKLPIAICNEHIAPNTTTIRIRRHLTATFLTDGGDFTISTSADGEHGRGLRQYRYFYDASDLPVFSLSMKGNGATWYMQLPGDSTSTSEPIAVLAPRWNLFTNKMHVYVRNSADNYAEVKLEVRGQVMFRKFTTEVYLDGALVMSARVKDIRHFEWVVKVARGFDISLASAILLISAWHWYKKGSSSYHGASGSRSEKAPS